MIQRGLFFLIMVFSWFLTSCSPESAFLNTTEKREANRLTEEWTTASFPYYDSLCLARQDSLMPFLIDSILTVREEEIRLKLENR